MHPPPDYLEFLDPQLAAVYDSLNPLGDDGRLFVRLADQLGGDVLIDLGCGTGLVTLELVRPGRQVIGIEPSPAMLDQARKKPGANRVEWVCGSWEALEGREADLVIMTSHVAQFFLDDDEWAAVLAAVGRCLRPGGRLVFDVRRMSDPLFPGWPTEERPLRCNETPLGPVEWWFTPLEASVERAKYLLHYRLADQGEVIVSVNELRFRTEAEVSSSAESAGFRIEAAYGGWGGEPLDAQAREMIFVLAGK